MIGVGFWAWLAIELEALVGRPFVGWTIDMDATTGDWLDVTFASGPNRQYTAAQAYTFAQNRWPGVWANADEMVAEIWAAWASWPLPDGTPPPEGGWAEAQRPRVRSSA